MNAFRTILLSAASLACVAAMPSFANAGVVRVNQAQRHVVRQEIQLGRAVNREVRTGVRPINNRAVVRVRV